MTTFGGDIIHLIGKELQVGDTAPDFTLTANDLSKKHLADFEGRKIISVVPSLDTGVCDTQTRTFNARVNDMESAYIITVSADLPFAQARWCGAAGLEKAITLSDYFDSSFGEAYGVLIEELHLLTRAVFVLDSKNTIVYAQYVPEIKTEPDYDAALEALKAAE